MERRKKEDENTANVALKSTYCNKFCLFFYYLLKTSAAFHMHAMLNYILTLHQILDSFHRHKVEYMYSYRFWCSNDSCIRILRRVHLVENFCHIYSINFHISTWDILPVCQLYKHINHTDTHIDKQSVATLD